MAGLFVTFEGGDGAGKSTQVAALARSLEERGYRVIVTREPGGTNLGIQIRQLLLHGEDVAPRAEALLFAADRAHHVATKILPALETGAVVISDRYFDSSVAYQGGARALDPNDVRDLSLWATNGLLPDLTVLLDVPVIQSIERVGASPDRLESEGKEFHQRVRDYFLQLAQAEPERFLLINGRLPISEIAQRVLHEVEKRLGSATNECGNTANKHGDGAACDAAARHESFMPEISSACFEKLCVGGAGESNSSESPLSSEPSPEVNT